jgi:hypothetical protein
VTVIYQGKAKSGGFVKYDVSEIVNKNFHCNKKIRKISLSG